FDGYEGWIDEKQYQPISESEYELLSSKEIVLNSDLIEYISGKDNLLFPIPLGASLSFLDVPQINTYDFRFEGLKVFVKKSNSENRFYVPKLSLFMGRKNTFRNRLFGICSDGV